MKSIYKFILVYVLFISSLFAGQGLQQKHLVSISPSSTEVRSKSSFIFTFDKPILQTSVKNHIAVLKQKKPQKQKLPTQFTVLDNKLVVSPMASLDKGVYVLKVKPLKLTEEGENTLLIKTSWQRFIAWLCGLMYKDISKCPLCQYFCYTSNTIKTKPIKFSFEIIEEMVQVKSIETNTSLVEFSEHNSTNISVTATYEDNSTEDVTQKATYTSNDTSVDSDKGVITSNVEGSATVTVSYGGKTSTLQVEVYEMIEGHLLPHEPQDPDATLLGVDANHNGVRDDVERWIFKEMATYDHPEMERAVSMQEAKAYQMTLVDPTNKDNKVLKAMDRAGDCWGYYVDITHFPFKYWEEFRHKLKDKQFNTKERLKTYFDYNRNLGAHVITLQTSTVDACDVNLDQLP